MNTETRKVRQKHIDTFEEGSPFYRGIGTRMVDVVEEEKKCRT